MSTRGDHLILEPWVGYSFRGIEYALLRGLLNKKKNIIHAYDVFAQKKKIIIIYEVGLSPSKKNFFD